LTASTAVGIEYNDVLFVGEVVRSMRWGSDEWAIDIKIAQTLIGLESLMILRSELDQHQSQSKDAPMEKPIPCEFPTLGKNKAAKSL
jgi:hypothetical protein